MTSRASAPSITEEKIRALSAAAGEPEWLLQRRLDAWRAYEAMAMPASYEEEWRRTDLSRVDFEEALAATGEPANRLEFESALPVGAVFTDLQTAARQHEAVVKHNLHALVRPDEWKLGALQAAGWQGGALVHVPRGLDVEVPLRYLVQQTGAPALPHLLIVAEPNSSVTIVQESMGEAPQCWSLVSGAVEIVCKEDSRVRFVDFQRLGSGTVVSFSTIRARLERGADLSASLVGLGGAIARTRLEVSLEGEGARAELLGLSFGNGKQHFDYVTLQDHLAPRTSSDLVFKAALDDSASEVWNGTVRIRKGAALSEASQTSRNLLLSNKAKAAPIPVLEIEAYDVLRCSHGASAGPLDEDQRFYLESRGIPPAAAERLLVEAFFNEVLDRIPVQPVREAAQAALLQRLEASL